MDSITHIVLGGALAMAVGGRRCGYGWAFAVGGLAATVPDFDVFFHTGEAMRDHALHRHFMHGLVLVPLLAAIALLPFLVHRKARPLWKPLYLAAVIACASHTLLDTLTSYGTMIFWPFSERRWALDVIAVVDPAYTVPLMAGVILAWRWKSARPAVAALVLSTAYLGVAWMQHGRAVEAQRQLIAGRGHAGAENPRVLPQVGAVISYRSLYVDDGRIYVDAIREPFFAGARVKAGGVLAVVDAAGLRESADVTAGRDFAMFIAMADGFVARSPGDASLLGDVRYAYAPEGLEPVWGIQVEETPTTRFRIIPRWSYFPKLLGDLFHPNGYVRLSQAGEAPHGP